jgi:hypothetical protein
VEYEPAEGKFGEPDPEFLYQSMINLQLNRSRRCAEPGNYAEPAAVSRFLERIIPF